MHLRALDYAARIGCSGFRNLQTGNNGVKARGKITEGARNALRVAVCLETHTQAMDADPCADSVGASGLLKMNEKLRDALTCHGEHVTWAYLSQGSTPAVRLP